MQKALNKKSEIAKFKEAYSEGKMHTEVIANLIQPYYTDKIPEIKHFNDILYENHVLVVMATSFGKAVLKERFGKCDFIFEGNRKYHNYILEHDGLVFIAAENREVVMPAPENKPEDFLQKLVNIEKAYLQMVIETLLPYSEKMNIFFQEQLKQMQDKGVIVDGKINFEPTQIKKLTP
jgi:hypothetical protein